MKAIICDHWAPPSELKLGELPSPEVTPGHVKIRVNACSINFADVLMVQGLYQEKPPFPFSPGLEAAGEVIEAGEGATYLKPGTRVMALCGHGGLAEEVVVAAQSVIPIPDNMPYEDAAAFAVAYGTSHIALDRRANLQPGETLLVHGAAGGVGSTAVEIGKLMGANVIATASTAEKLDFAREIGADHTINYTEENFIDRVKEITGKKGADVILDPVGGDVLLGSLRCVAWEGRILVIGFAAGEIPQVPANLMLLKNCSVMGTYWGKYAQRNPQALLQSLQQLMQWYGEGKIKPRISQTFALADTAAAMESLMHRKATGKVVVTID